MACERPMNASDASGILSRPPLSRWPPVVPYAFTVVRPVTPATRPMHGTFSGKLLVGHMMLRFRRFDGNASQT